MTLGHIYSFPDPPPTPMETYPGSTAVHTLIDILINTHCFDGHANIF